MTVQAIEDRFRPKYRELTPIEQQRVARITQKAMDLATEFYPFDSREKSLAVTSLEESVMWAVKAITGPKE